MAYDALAESVRLIESRELQPVLRLSRRRRFAAMSVDIADDVAVTTFARRGVGCLWSETHILVQRQGLWQMVGGGGASEDENLLGPRPGHLPAGPVDLRATKQGVDPRVFVIGGGGGVSVPGSGQWPRRSRWISYVDIRVNADVVSIVVDGRRIPVPWHGRLAVLGGRRGSFELALYDGAGRLLGTVRAQHPKG
ncbi:hypothetical protein KC207_07465 [Phycicoccus sp. BSK3Z-2]|uniref:Uncharacterized protein n=1 Tax=Phycicoccus avicenniae TaxID=2828860 RepID=A0A941D7W6_9MICO|nr:hypothetical protein [Phycicoccus avicenniae]MBR7743126.1 hypothetical protein [Phycicoccus avicenniae]